VPSGTSLSASTIASANRAIGAATMNTAWTPWMMSVRVVALSIDNDDPDALVPARAANTAPNTAAPIAPPSPRKNEVVAIAIPSSRRSTLFWTAVIRTWPTIPKPRPNRPSVRPTAVLDGCVAINASVASAIAIRPNPSSG